MFKENQPELLDDIKDSFKMLEHNDFTENLNFGHGWIETVKCAVITDLSLIEKPTLWKSLTSIVRVESERYIKSTGVTQSETGYYISNLCRCQSIITCNQITLGNWKQCSLESLCGIQWRLKPQKSQKCSNELFYIQQIALNMIKKEKSKMGLKAKRFLAGWSQEYILKVLKF